MNPLARALQCGGAGAVRAVLARWMAPGSSGITAGQHPPQHWARPKHWETSSTTVPALIIHKSSNLLWEIKPWMRWSGWGPEQQLSVSSIFALSLHPTEMQHKKQGREEFFICLAQKDLAAAEVFDLFPAWTPASFSVAEQPRSKVVMSWGCHPLLSPCLCDPPHGAGHSHAALNGSGSAIPASHSHILLSGSVESTDALLTYISYSLGILYFWRAGQDAGNKGRTTQRPEQGLPGKWPWESLTPWLCKLLTPKPLFPDEQADVTSLLFKLQTHINGLNLHSWS